jgi:hypothetical protein
VSLFFDFDLVSRVCFPQLFLSSRIRLYSNLPLAMAQQYIRRYDALGAKTTAPPVLSLPSQAPQAMDNEPEFFQMDSLDFMWQGEGFDPFPVWSDEIDQGQVLRMSRLWYATANTATDL